MVYTAHVTRTEHLEWAKTRALQYVDRGDCVKGLTSFMSDLKKHPELQDHPAIEVTGIMLFSRQLTDPRQVRTHILGFN